MDYDDLSARIRSWSSVARVTQYGSLREAGRRFPLFRLDTPGRRRVLITAGFHGEEPAGPLTLGRHFGEIAAFARARKIGLTVFPCINPSGFAAGTRYNASGEKPNNDLMRYRVGPKKWVGELMPGREAFLSWKLFRKSPKETRAVLRQLEHLPTPLAALDLHQDDYMRRAATYAYVFGGSKHYRPLVRKSARHADVARRTLVDPHLRTDEDGLIEFHDGSITDYFMRRGSRFCATLATPTRTPMEKCDAVNLIWVYGFINLAFTFE